MSERDEPIDKPLGGRLHDLTDEAVLQRIWEGVDARLPRRRPRRRPIPRLAPAIALGLASLGLASLGLFLWLRPPRPLQLADGRPLTAIEARAPLSLSLSDGSRVELGAGARFEPLEISDSAFTAMLARGSATFDVRPGGPRRWNVECGLATVEVVGTRFACERTPERLRVSVERGVVLVRGERVPDRIRRLAAGESVDVFPAPASPPPAAAPEPAAVAEAAGEAAHLEPPSLSAPRGGAAPWRELARHQRQAEAFSLLGSEGFRRESNRSGVEDLLMLADVARLSGHPAAAVYPLERLLARFSADSRASLAAFALGRLELDALDRPARAAAALERALGLGIPRGLREDVEARLVEAYARAGSGAAARTEAQAYAREFPGGRHTAEVASWVTGR